VFAGPFFNFIMAFIGAFIIICCVGYDKPTLSGVIDGYAAQEAGLMEGDTITKMNGHSIHFYREVSAYSLFHEGETVEIEYLRDGEKYTAVLTPKYDEENGRYLYGVIGNYEYTKGNVLDSAVNAVYEVRYWIYTTLQSLKMLLTGGASVNDLSGPVGIVQNMGEVYDESVSSGGYYAAFINMLNWMVLLSANLGVMNLLPLPALDGGRLVFLLVEAVRRKRIDPEKEGYVHMIGIVLLMLLMVFVMFNDIRNLF
jgi:regulator of sigma E protease